MSGWMVGSVLIPVGGAVAAFALPRQLGAAAGLVCAVALLVVSGALAAGVGASGPVEHVLGGWATPLGIALRADGLSVVMLAVTAVVSALVSLYAPGYFGVHTERQPWRQQEGFWPLWLVLWGSMNLVYLSGDIFNLYIGLEIVGLSAVALIALGGQRVALMSAMRYLLAALLGSLAYLMGVALLYGQYHALDLHLLAERVEPGFASWLAMALMTVGLMLKTALFPLHFWLPPAHSSAPAPVSAALSALVVKASFYLILRLWLEVFDGLLTPALVQGVGVLGAMAIVGGSVQAMFQRRMKMLVAYSTVAQIGYLFVLIPLAVGFDGQELVWRLSGYTGGMYHLIAHALAKAAMFLAAGTVIVAMGSDQIRRFRGMATQLPVTTFAFGLAGINLIGLPPSAGFVGKWFMVSAAIESGQWWWAVVLLSGGLLAGVYIFLVMRYAFLPPLPPHFEKPPRSMEAVTLGLALIALVLGLRASETFMLLGERTWLFGS